MSEAKWEATKRRPVHRVVRRGRGSGRDATRGTGGHRHVKRGEQARESGRVAASGRSESVAARLAPQAAALNVY